MIIAISGSLDFSFEMSTIKKQLEKNGFKVILPPTAKDILDGKEFIDKIKEEKRQNKFSQRAIKSNAIKRYYNLIKTADALLVLNITKKNIDNYIGGNTFLEMGFAHILNKPIFLYNDMPNMNYSDEIKAMQPILLKGVVSNIKNYIKKELIK